MTRRCMQRARPVSGACLAKVPTGRKSGRPESYVRSSVAQHSQARLWDSEIVWSQESYVRSSVAQHSQAGFWDFEITWSQATSARRRAERMVRRIVGGLVEVGKGRIPPEQMPVASRKVIPTAPPGGLCLDAVEFPPEFPCVAETIPPPADLAPPPWT